MLSTLNGRSHDPASTAVERQASFQSIVRIHSSIKLTIGAIRVLNLKYEKPNADTAFIFVVAGLGGQNL
ncbi:MAG TPA: hypothetical protein VHU21_21440, partial [Paraburkholderia sp.]|nr:hypothetical protein [Paraburkholderia sp.]